MKCTATSKRTGHPCGANAVTGMTVCYHHGGKTPMGIAAPSFKTGRYSKVLPERLLARYHESLTDATLLTLEAEIALLDSRLSDVLGRVDTGESGGLWKQAQKAYRDIASADIGIAAAARLTLGSLLADGVADYAAWGEVQALVQQRRVLVESERKHLVEQQQMVRVEQALVFVAALMDSVKRHVTDRSTLAAIAADLTRLTGGPGGVVVDGEHRRTD